MKHKLFGIVYIVVGLFVCLIPLVFIGVEASDTNEESSDLPAFQDDDKLNTEYLQELGSWFEDNCGFRTEMVSFNARLMSDIFGVSAVDNITVGSNNWLYASATDDSYKGIGKFSDRIKFNIAHNILILQQSVENKGSKFLLTIPANKNTLYPENMPYYIKPVAENTNLLELSRELKSQGVNYVDMYDLFSAQDEVLYLKLDSHWNNKGALLAYNGIMDSLGSPHNTYSGAKAVDNREYVGDLSSAIYPMFVKKENNPRYQAVSELDKNIDVEADSITTYNDSGTGSLLMYRDSFANTLIPLLSGEYNISHYAKSKSEYFTDYKVQNDITAYDPDTVLVEIVERHILDFAYYAPVIENPQVKGIKENREVNTKTTCGIKTSDNMYVIHGIVDYDNLTDQSEIYVELSHNKGDSKIYNAYNMSYTTDNGQSDYGYKVYLPSNNIPKGDVTLRILVNNGKSVVCVKEISKNISNELPLNSVFGTKDNNEITGNTAQVIDTEFTKVNDKDSGFLYVYNQTGQDVSEVRIKKSNSEKWSSNILKANITADDKSLLYLPVNQNNKVKYDIRLKYKNGQSHTASGVPLYDTHSLTLYRTKNYSYIKYFSSGNKKIIGTKNKEKAVYDAKIAAQIARKKALAEAKRKAAEEKARQEAEQATTPQPIAVYVAPTTQAAQNTATQPNVQNNNGGCLSGVQIRDNYE